MVYLHRVRVAAVNWVEFFLCPHFVNGHDAVLQGLRKERRPRSQITPEQVAKAELEIVRSRFLNGQQLAGQLLLDALGPWQHRVACEHEVLLLNVVVRRLTFELHQGRRYREDAANFLGLKLARFDKLRFFRCDGDAAVFEAKRQQLGAGTGHGAVPRLLQHLHLLRLQRLVA